MSDVPLFRCAAAVLALGASSAAQLPDLSITAIDRTAVSGNWQTLQIGGSAAVTVFNQGPAASPACTLLLFEDTDRNAAYTPGTDRVLGQAPVAALAATASASVNVPVVGTVRFRDDLLYAFVDSGVAVAEGDESNNLWDTSRHAAAAPQPGPFAPVLEWSWTSTATLPSSVRVPCTPLVCDLDDDGFAEIVFQTMDTPSRANEPAGVLRAIDGRNGAEKFTVTNSAHAVVASCTPAIGDIDNDGRPEIVAVAPRTPTARLIAFEHDGTFKWFSDPIESVGFGAVTIADLNQDGTPEIVVGRQALDDQGKLLWTGAGGSANHIGFARASTVADVDADGQPEVVAGFTVYGPTGQIEANLANGNYEGISAIGNFDQDAQAEIATVAYGRVHLLNHDLTQIWGPVMEPNSTRGGAPVVADFDGDGLPEVGVAGHTRYTVYDTDGTVLWQQTIQDGSSGMTASSAFDFTGDGSAELLFRDEKLLRVYRGTDGMVLWSTPLNSCTWVEYCTIADVDGDGSAEIVCGANDSCGVGPLNGIFVFGDPAGRWVGAPPVWNQFHYAITNVRDDGTIPAVAPNHWRYPSGAPYNAYRQNALVPRRAVPDLTASSMMVPCAPGYLADVRVGNGGARFVAPGVRVDFWDGDPQSGGVLLGSALTAVKLGAGDYASVALAVPSTIAGPLFAVVDPQNAVVESNEANNWHSQALCAVSASFTNYGAGWPGTLGVPALTLDAAPQLGTQRLLRVGNSAGALTAGGLLLGTAPVSLPTGFGGTLLVLPTITAPLTLAAGTTSLPFALQCVPSFCGVSLYFQVVEVDVGASHGVSFTRGLLLTLGR